MNENELYNGGCACNEIRCNVSGSAAMVAHCHCDDCRKSSASAALVLAGFHQQGFELLTGKPTCFEATPAVKRSFCKICGTALFYENQNFAENIYIHIGSFDHPEKRPLDRRSWVSEPVSWHKIKDDLKQFDQLSNVGLPGNTPPYDRLAGC